jgi:hypothetical protein
MKLFKWLIKNDENVDPVTGDFDLGGGNGNSGENVGFLMSNPILRIKRSMFRKSSALSTVDSRLSSSRSSPRLKKSETQL